MSRLVMVTFCEWATKVCQNWAMRHEMPSMRMLVPCQTVSEMGLPSRLPWPRARSIQAWPLPSKRALPKPRSETSRPPSSQAVDRPAYVTGKLRCRQYDRLSALHTNVPWISTLQLRRSVVSMTCRMWYVPSRKMMVPSLPHCRKASRICGVSSMRFWRFSSSSGGPWSPYDDGASAPASASSGEYGLSLLSRDGSGRG